MAKQEKELIGLCYVDGGEPTLWAQVEAACGGLAVSEGERRKGRPWVITHIASGLRVSHYPTRDAAIMSLARLTMFLDWSGSADEVCHSEAHCSAGHAEALR